MIRNSQRGGGRSVTDKTESALGLFSILGELVGVEETAPEQKKYTFSSWVVKAAI